LNINWLTAIRFELSPKKENPTKGKDLNLINIEVKYPLTKPWEK